MYPLASILTPIIPNAQVLLKASGSAASLAAVESASTTSATATTFEPATTSAPASTTFGTTVGFSYSDAPAFYFKPLSLVYSLGRLVFGRHFHKSEPTRLAAETVFYYINRFNLTETLKRLFQIFLAYLACQVTHIEIHLFPFQNKWVRN
jgi:hypothetical protein